MEKQNPPLFRETGCNHCGGDNSSLSLNQQIPQVERRVSGTLAIPKTLAMEAIIWRYFSAGTVTHV